MKSAPNPKLAKIKRQYFVNFPPPRSAGDDYIFDTCCADDPCRVGSLLDFLDLFVQVRDGHA